MSDTITVPVSLADRSYDILIGKGLIERAGAEISARLPGVRAAIVTDDVVGPLHFERLQDSLAAAGIHSTPIVIPAGEKSKSFTMLEQVVRQTLQARLERRDVLIAFGGGVVGMIRERMVGLVECGEVFGASQEASHRLGGQVAVRDRVAHGAAGHSSHVTR